MSEIAVRNKVRAQMAVEIVKSHLDAIPHPEVGILRLVQFNHNSPGLDKLRRQIAEGLIGLLEDNGMLIFNGVNEAIEGLEERGYTVFVGEPVVGD